MFQMLLSLIFTVVGNLMQIIMTPFINLIISLFPDAEAYFLHIVTFFNYGFSYLCTVLKWLLFTSPMFLLLFDYYAIKFSVWVISSGVRFGLKLYNALKP